MVAPSGARNDREDVALVLDGGELALEGIEEKKARPGHGEADQKNERPDRERAVQQGAIGGRDPAARTRSMMR